MPLRDQLKARFSSAIKSLPPGVWKILITDNHSQALLDSVYSNYDILQQNVTSVEPLHSPRQPMGVDALYLLTPTSQNVDRIIADFSSGRRTYKSAHVYFIDGIDDQLADRLTRSLPPDILKAFVELYCDFWPIEERVWTVRQPSAFYTFFGSPGGAASSDLAVEAFEDDVALSARQILNLLATLNENPYIRFYQPAHHGPLGALALTASGQGQGQAPGAGGGAVPSAQARGDQPQSLRWRSAMAGGPPAGGSRPGQVQPEHLSKRLANEVQGCLDEYMRNNPEFPTPSNRPRATLFIVDRTMDPVAPFLHEFWYQAMINDLIDIKDGKYNYTYEDTKGNKQAKDGELREDDPVYTSLRHMHMKDAIDNLNQSFYKFTQEHAGFQENAQVGVNDLKDMLASLPQFNTQREQYSLQFDLSTTAMDKFQKNNLSTLAHVEQCCATGYTSEGRVPKNLVEEMVPILGGKLGFSQWDKVRIIALYILFRDGVEDEDRRRLYQHARLSISEQDAVNNLVFLGQRVVKDPKDRSHKSRIKQKYREVGEEYELSRYHPLIEWMLEEHHNNRLDQTQFPFLKEVPPELTAAQSMRGGQHLAPQPSAPSSSLRSARPTWHKTASSRATNYEGRQRLILFVAGGVTYSEMRTAYVLGQKLGKEVIIGSTHVVTPESFCKDLRFLGRGGVAANPPNSTQLPAAGAPGRSNNRPPGQPQPYQAILDQRYWQPPVGPPPAHAPPPQPVGAGGRPQGTPNAAQGGAGGAGSMGALTNKMGDMGLGHSSKPSSGGLSIGSLKSKKNPLSAVGGGPGNGRPVSSGDAASITSSVGDEKKKKGLMGRMKW